MTYWSLGIHKVFYNTQKFFILKLRRKNSLAKCLHFLLVMVYFLAIKWIYFPENLKDICSTFQQWSLSKYMHVPCICFQHAWEREREREREREKRLPWVPGRCGVCRPAETVVSESFSAVSAVCQSGGGSRDAGGEEACLGGQGQLFVCDGWPWLQALLWFPPTVKVQIIWETPKNSNTYIS